MRKLIIHLLKGYTEHEAQALAYKRAVNAQEYRDRYWRLKIRLMLSSFLQTKSHGHLRVTPVRKELEAYTLHELEGANE